MFAGLNRNLGLKRVLANKNNMNIFRNSKGQLLVVVPILVILIVGAILLTVNISKMCHEHIKIQTTADIAARNGALIQALALDSITVLNDAIIALYVRMVGDVGCMFSTCWWPPTWDECEAHVGMILRAHITLLRNSRR